MLNRIQEAKITTAVVAVAVVASLTRFLFSHPICLVDMLSALSSTGKFMKSTSRHLPPAFRSLGESISLERAE